METTKQFDCVRMKHEAALRIHRQLRGKSLSQRLAFWKAAQRRMLKRSAREQAA